MYQVVLNKWVLDEIHLHKITSINHTMESDGTLFSSVNRFSQKKTVVLR